MTELAGRGRRSPPRSSGRPSARGRDREDKPEYKVKIIGGALLLQSGEPHRVLPQLLLAGIRRRAGEGRPQRLCLRRSTPICKPDSKYTKNEIQDHLPGRAGLPGAGDQLLLHADLLREPDEKGHHQQVRPGGHDRVLPAAACTSTSSKTRPRPTEIADQVLINKRSRETAEKAAAEHQEEADRHPSTSPTACRNLWTAARRTSRAARLYIVEGDSAMGSVKLSPRRGISGHHARARQDPKLPEGGL